MKTFNVEAALEFTGGESDLLNELLVSFVDDKKFTLSQLEDEEKKDKAEAAKFVHYYKGAGRQIAAEKLAFYGQQLEDYLRGKSEGNGKCLEELNQDFFREYYLAVEAVKNYLAGVS